MRFNISRDQLISVLNIMNKGVSSRSTLPILSGLYIEVQGTQAVFQTTDLEISIKHTALVDVIEPGSTVVPAKLFTDIVKRLPDAAVEVSSADSNANIICMDSSFTLSTLNPVDFPHFPSIETDMSVSLPTKDLADAVSRCSKSVSKDESRAILSGIYFALDEDMVHLAATDSYRLTCVDIKVEGQEFESFNAVIPGKIFNDVTGLSTSEEFLNVAFSENQVVFTFGNTTFISRRIEGTYPNYKQLIPMSKGIEAIVDRKALYEAIKRVAILAQAHTPIKLSFDTETQKLTISAQSQDMGSAKEVIPVELNGESIDIAFNHQYLEDGLSSIAGEVSIEMQASHKPGILRQVGNENFLYLAMPVRLN